MGSITHIQEKVKKLEGIKTRIGNLETLARNEFTSFSEVEEINKEIVQLRSQLHIVDSEGYEQKLEKMLDQLDIDVEKIEKLKVEYIIGGMIVKAEITMIAAKPGEGKSLITLAICNMGLIAGSVEKVIYFDADNGGTTLSERGISMVKQRHGKNFRYIHDSTSTKAQMWQLIKTLKSTNLQNVLIVIDSIKNFMGGKDRDKNKDVSEVLQVLKELRSKGATVIFLHHTNKPQKDLQESDYAGSSAFEEDSGNTFLLKHNQFRKTFVLEKRKNRVGQTQDTAFTYHPKSHSLRKVELMWAKELFTDEAIRLEIQDYLKSCKEPPCYSQIFKHVCESGLCKDNNKINKVIQNGKERYWIAKKIREQNNKDVFELMIAETSDKSDCLENSINIGHNPSTLESACSDSLYKRHVNKSCEGE
ncbi:MAG: AAA family ATPase [Sulfuricurvum sp.]|nr:AAA family ATPase [Sulfuricurvum sp.]